MPAQDNCTSVRMRKLPQKAIGYPCIAEVSFRTRANYGMFIGDNGKVRNTGKLDLGMVDVIV